MRPVIGFLLLGLIAKEATGQKQANVWVFPNGNKIDFNVNPPIHSDEGMIFNPVGSVTEGVACIADSSGNLLFYSDGTAIWSSDHIIIPNGDGLLGHTSSTQAAYILPFTERNDMYYVFTTDAWENGLANGLRYSVVSLCEEDGPIRVIQKNVLLRNNVTEKLCATRQENGVDYWLLAHERGTSKFLVFSVSQSGIELRDSASIGQLHPQNPQGAVGQMKFSPQGDRIALTISNTPTPGLELFDFDIGSGSVSNPVFFNPDSLEGSPMAFYGLSFSPDGSMLYAAPFYWERLYQISLSQGNSPQQLIASSLLLNSIWNSPVSISQLQIAPNGKVYGTISGSSHLIVINEPNLAGISCDFVKEGFSLGANSSNWGLPGFVDNFNYSSAGNCDTLNSITETTATQPALLIYPNPASQEMRLQVTGHSQQVGALAITDMLGHKVLNSPPGKEGPGEVIFEMDISTLAPGLYTVSATLQGGETLRQRLVVQQ